MSDILINYNGTIAPGNKTLVSPLDRGFLFGDSIYETTIARGEKILFLPEHLKRLDQSADILRMQVTQTHQWITEQVMKTLAAAKLKSSLVRIVITRGDDQINLSPTEGVKTNCFIFVKELKAYPNTWYDDGVNFIIAKTRRNPVECLSPMAKSGNYLNNLLALMEAKEAKAHDALLLNTKGHLTEGTTNNFWFVKNNKVFTPCLKCGLLNGITRDKIFSICESAGIAFEEGQYTPQDLAEADEAFYSSSTKGAVPVVVIDQKKVGHGKVGPIAKKINDLYQKDVDQLLGKI